MVFVLEETKVEKYGFDGGPLVVESEIIRCNAVMTWSSV